MQLLVDAREPPRASLRIEDLGISTIMFVAPKLDPLHALLPFAGDSGSSAGALLSLIAVMGAITAMATRVPGEARVESRTPGADPERMWMIGPFIGAVGFLGADSLGRPGIPGGEALVGVAFLLCLAAVLLADRLPVVSRSTRRMLVAPFVLLSGAFFGSLVTGAVDAFGGEVGSIARQIGSESPFLLIYILVLIGFVAGIFYLMLIFVPRELADPGGSSAAWTLRFAVFYGTLLAAVLVHSDVPVLFT